ncbi:hypothetical protein Rhe02_75460 [Rhizocola hellebori]|uniref:Pyridoxamine 5'-phosphate oxidase family protein n=2 Tax=Rhizocola hellebori TaxID=1392758 RepID=A0A8J3QEP3_9ACTN|nr:hypothetical protein Rhe02_75460 [Rhizocola hellebori]
MSPPVTAESTRMIELDAATSLHLLSTIEFGRLVFTLNAMPAIRPVNHLVDGGEILIRASLPARSVPYTAGVPMPEGTVVAYEADEIDAQHRSGWTVVVTGIATPVLDPARHRRSRPLLKSWVHQPEGALLVVQPQLITGYRLCDG